MSYADKILQPDERLLHVAGLHWLLYLPCILLGLAALAAAAGSTWLRGGDAIGTLYLAAALALLAILNWVRALLERVSTELSVTDRRIIYKRGLVRRRTIEMNMSKVESVDVDQSLLGRLLDYGTVTVRGTGGGIEPLPRIADPIGFRNSITAR
jgi:uncharacterized membrane protein YdbT with pleckstrin-like domain